MEFVMRRVYFTSCHHYTNALPYCQICLALPAHLGLCCDRAHYGAKMEEAMEGEK